MAPPETTTELFGDDIATQGSLDARESGQLGNVRGRRKESVPVFSRGYTQNHKEIGKTRISLGVKRVYSYTIERLSGIEYTVFVIKEKGLRSNYPRAHIVTTI